MADRLLKHTPRSCVQHGRFAEQNGYELWDLSLSSSGHVAMSGYNEKTYNTFIDVYSWNIYDDRGKPNVIYSKEYLKYSSGKNDYWIRYVAFLEPYDKIVVSCIGNMLELIQVIEKKVQVYLRLNSEASCMSVRGKEIFVGFYQSTIVVIYDGKHLHRVKSIMVEGIQNGDFPYNMSIFKDEVLMSTWKGKSFLLQEKSRRILLHVEVSTRPPIFIHSITADLSLGVVAVLRSTSDKIEHLEIAFHSINENPSFLVAPFLVVRVDCGTSIIKFWCRGKKMITGNYRTGEVKMFSMEELFSYDHMKEDLSLRLNRGDCLRLAKFFALPKEQKETISHCEKPTEELISALEERGVIQEFSVATLKEAFLDLEIPTSCHVMQIYQITRDQATLYAKFLVMLSDHLTASLPISLCGYFNFSDTKTKSIASSQNPGLSILLALDEMRIITPSDVRALEQPFNLFKLVQTVAKIHEYQSTVKEEQEQFHKGTISTFYGKKEELVKFLRKKIKSLYETKTPVPWKKSCRWKLSELYVGSGLMLTKSNNKRSLMNIDEQCKLNYKDIFKHEQLQYETRIIVEGDPGSGKTMLASQLAYDWSQGEFNDIDILILLPLKFVGSKTLSESVVALYVPDDEGWSEEDVESVITDESIRCCFILDGLEEYRRTGDPSEVTKIITKSKYPTCKVIITARSDFAQSLPSCPVLKIGKFGEAEKSAYLEKVFPDDRQKQLEVTKSIEDNPFILDLCSVPLLYVIIVHNIKHMERIQEGNVDRVTPFMESMVNTLFLSVTSEAKMQGADNQTEGKSSLEEIAFGGLCRGLQQLSWHKQFIDTYVSNSKQWLDSGVIVVDDSNVTLLGRRNQRPALPDELRSIEQVTDKESHSREMTEEKSKQTSQKSALDYSESNQNTVDVGNLPVILTSQIEESDEDTHGFLPFQFEFEQKSKPNEKQEIQSEHERTLEKQKLGDNVSTIKREENLIQSTGEVAARATNVNMEVKFLHKIIQEWFAAKYFSSTLSALQTSKEQQEHLQCNLPLINPADLHYVLRFTCGLQQSCCPIIIKHLLRRYHSVEGNKPEYIMNCIMLCFIEYNGDIRPEILDAVSAVWKEDFIVRSEDSRLLQQAKVSLLQLASDCGIKVKRLLLVDLIVSASEDILRFNSGVAIKAMDTLQGMEISRWDQTLLEEDYFNIVKFIAKCPRLTEVYLHFPSTPPKLDMQTFGEMEMENKSVTWIIGPKLRHTLQATTGKWMFEGEINVSTYDSDLHLCQIRNDGLTMKTQKIISKEGGALQIPKTGVKLVVPPNAFLDESHHCNIEIRLLDSTEAGGRSNSFASNSTVAVELLPNHLKLKQPAELTLPHCLQIKQGTKYGAEVLISHHEEGSEPEWEKQSVSMCKLRRDACLVTLSEFCWVKCEIDDRVVEAKHLQVYTASKRISPDDKIAKIEVGYYPDLDGAGKLLRMNRNWIVTEQRPFLFLKEGAVPLRILFNEVAPPVWKYCIPNDNPKIISFQTIASSTECSCPFIIQKQDEGPCYFMFKVSQASEYIELTSPLQVEETKQLVQDMSEAESHRELSCRQFSSNSSEEPKGAEGGTFSKNVQHDERENLVVPGAVGIYEPAERRTFENRSQGLLNVQLPASGLLPYRESKSPAFHYPVVHHYEHTQNVYFATDGDKSCMPYEDDVVEKHGLSLPYLVLKRIAMMLDQEDPLGNDWKELAGELGFTTEEILTFKRKDTPTFFVVQSAVKRGILTSPGQLKKILQKMKRIDAASLISN